MISPKIFSLAGPMIVAFLTTGCVMLDLHLPPAYPAEIKDLKQLEGVYVNECVKMVGDSGELQGHLFRLLGTHIHSSYPQDLGNYVIITFPGNDYVMHVQLLNNTQKEIDRLVLKRGVDYELSGRAIILHWPKSGWHDISSNFGPATANSRTRIYRSSSGALLGKYSETKLGLLCDIIPVAETSKEWCLWPRTNLNSGINLQ